MDSLLPFFSPDGRKFRSKTDLAYYFLKKGLDLDPDRFDFTVRGAENVKKADTPKDTHLIKKVIKHRRKDVSQELERNSERNKKNNKQKTLVQKLVVKMNFGKRRLRSGGPVEETDPTESPRPKRARLSVSTEEEEGTKSVQKTNKSPLKPSNKTTKKGAVDKVTSHKKTGKKGGKNSRSLKKRLTPKKKSKSQTKSKKAAKKSSKEDSKKSEPPAKKLLGKMKREKVAEKESRPPVIIVTDEKGMEVKEKKSKPRKRSESSTSCKRTEGLVKIASYTEKWDDVDGIPIARLFHGKQMPRIEEIPETWMSKFPKRGSGEYIVLDSGHTYAKMPRVVKEGLGFVALQSKLNRSVSVDCAAASKAQTVTKIVLNTTKTSNVPLSIRQRIVSETATRMEPSLAGKTSILPLNVRQRTVSETLAGDSKMHKTIVVVKKRTTPEGLAPILVPSSMSSQLSPIENNNNRVVTSPQPQISTISLSPRVEVRMNPTSPPILLNPATLPVTSQLMKVKMDERPRIILKQATSPTTSRPIQLKIDDSRHILVSQAASSTPTQSVTPVALKSGIRVIGPDGMWISI
jgi:hypothetical protein